MRRHYFELFVLYMLFSVQMSMGIIFGEKSNANDQLITKFPPLVLKTKEVVVETNTNEKKFRRRPPGNWKGSTMAATIPSSMIANKVIADKKARQGNKVPRTDRLDGGAKLDERRRLAEKNRSASGYHLVPQDVLCPRCGHQNLTTITKQRGWFTWLLCLAGCIWAPFCDCTKDTVHSCTHCKAQLAIVKKTSCNS